MNIVIRGGIIVDGTGAPARRADLFIENDTILSVGEIHKPTEPVIDASGLVVAPGFIDIHSHTDEMFLAHPLADSKLLQGVTCEVGGNCGTSPAPVTEEHRSLVADELKPYEIGVQWQDLAGFFAQLEAAGIGPNCATLAGHGNVRGAVIGYDDRKANASELAQMHDLACQMLDQGACGISAGLIYPPGCYADTAELAAVCAAVRGRGFFSVHLRDEGAGLLEAVREVLEVARTAGISLQLSHHKAGGQANWGLVRQSIALIESARAAGMDVTADAYPYTATHTSLSAVLPDWIKSGGREVMLARLQNDAALAQLEQEWGPRSTEVERWDEYHISRTFSEQNRACEGRRIGHICREQGLQPLALICHILIADAGRTEMMRFCISEADIETVLRRPWVMIGSDAGAKTFSDEWGCPHPRAFGTFPRILVEYVRKRRVLSLEEAIRKMTSLPAWRLGLPDRGRIVPGCKADLVIFDPEAVADRATFEQPLHPPSGIEWVIINGTIAAQSGRFTGDRPGKILRANHATANEVCRR